MNQNVNLMFICEIMYRKHGLSLYDNESWKRARACIAKGFELDANCYIGGLFIGLREEVGLRAKTFTDQLETTAALNKEIEELKKLDFPTLKKMVSDFQT